jgi:hypothetical protein
MSIVDAFGRVLYVAQEAGPHALTYGRNFCSFKYRAD